MNTTLYALYSAGKKHCGNKLEMKQNRKGGVNSVGQLVSLLHHRLWNPSRRNYGGFCPNQRIARCRLHPVYPAEEKSLITPSQFPHLS